MLSVLKPSAKLAVPNEELCFLKSIKFYSPHCSTIMDEPTLAATLNIFVQQNSER